VVGIDRCFVYIQVKLTKIPYIGTLYDVRFFQGSVYRRVFVILEALFGIKYTSFACSALNQDNVDKQW